MEQQHYAIDYRRKWYAMAAVSVSVFLATIDGSIVNIALPTLVRYFHTDFATVQWVPLAYMLVLTTLLLSVGRLADIVGKKAIYNSGVVVFTIGSILCGLAPSIEWLILFRMLQALGAAMTIALGSAIITESFPPSERGKALGIIGSIVSIGVIVGPTVGGFLIDAFTWHWIFFVNVPVGIVGTWLAYAFLPNNKPPNTQQRFDFVGAGTLFVSLTSFLLALTLGQQMGFTSRVILALFATAVLFFGVFIIIEMRVRQPMIQLQIFRNNLISLNLLMAVCTFVAITGTVLLIPFYLENILGHDTRNVGLLMAVVPVTLGITSPISGILSDKFGTRNITTIGLLVLVAGYYGLGYLDSNTSTIHYILLLFPIGLGMGIFQSPNNSAIMGTAPREQLGIISGLLAESRVLGQTIGVALVGAIWASRVFTYIGHPLKDGATAAPIEIQVAALHDTFLFMVSLLIVALLLNIWTIVRQRMQSPPLPRSAE